MIELTVVLKILNLAVLKRKYKYKTTSKEMVFILPLPSYYIHITYKAC